MNILTFALYSTLKYHLSESCLGKKKYDDGNTAEINASVSKSKLLDFIDLPVVVLMFINNNIVTNITRWGERILYENTDDYILKIKKRIKNAYACMMGATPYFSTAAASGN